MLKIVMTGPGRGKVMVGDQEIPSVVRIDVRSVAQDLNEIVLTIRPRTFELAAPAEKPIEAEVTQRVEELRRVAPLYGMQVTADGRVGVGDGARLAGINPDRMRRLINQGKGPPTYRLGMGRHKCTVRLDELANWLVRRDGGAQS
jgi:hypothetical protein